MKDANYIKVYDSNNLIRHLGREAATSESIKDHNRITIKFIRDGFFQNLTRPFKKFFEDYINRIYQEEKNNE